jgi:hypothetical protein
MIFFCLCSKILKIDYEMEDEPIAPEKVEQIQREQKRHNAFMDKFKPPANKRRKT